MCCFSGALFFDLAVRGGFRDDIGEELKVVDAGYGVGCCLLSLGYAIWRAKFTKIFVLEITPWLPFGFDDIVRLLCQIADKELLERILMNRK